MAIRARLTDEHWVRSQRGSEWLVWVALSVEERGGDREIVKEGG
jgi:hypothetical protein